MEKFHRAPVKTTWLWRSSLATRILKSEQPDSYELQKNFTVIERRLQPPSEAEITEILHRMGKTKPSDELNCGSCGYKSGTWTVDEGESLRYCHGWSATNALSSGESRFLCLSAFLGRQRRLK